MELSRSPENLIVIPSGSTRITLAFFYCFPLMVWKFCASASDADSAAKIAMIVFLGFMREFCLIALHTTTTK